MDSIDGLIYLLNQSGIALAQANERISVLAKENDKLILEVQEIMKNIK